MRNGFTKGDDGKDYFFHESEFRDKHQITYLYEDAYLRFDQQATSRGYKAINCSVINPSEVRKYITPGEFIVSKSNSVG
jgi:cold shock CspA family protein